MKKLMIVLALGVLAACGGEDKKAEEVVKDQPLVQSKNSLEFNRAFAAVLSDYYHLKDALVLSNDTMANAAASRLMINADSLSVDLVKADSNIVDIAKGYVQSIQAETAGLVGERNIEEKRKSFQIISDNMYDLVRVVQYDREKIYHQFCPMAFNDQGGYWLSNSSDIKNPYFGKKMLTCGEVKDSISYAAQ